MSHYFFYPCGPLPVAVVFRLVPVDYCSTGVPAYCWSEFVRPLEIFSDNMDNIEFNKFRATFKAAANYINSMKTKKYKV